MDVYPVKENTAGIRFFQCQNDLGKRGLSTARLTHEAKGLIREYIEIHPVNCIHISCGLPENT